MVCVPITTSGHRLAAEQSLAVEVDVAEALVVGHGSGTSMTGAETVVSKASLARSPLLRALPLLKDRLIQAKVAAAGGEVAAGS